MKTLWIAGTVLAWAGAVMGATRLVDTESATVTIEIPRQEAYYVCYERIPETVPRAVFPVDISDGGVYDRDKGLIKWGPFDQESRTLSYRIVAAADGRQPEETVVDLAGGALRVDNGFPVAQNLGFTRVTVPPGKGYEGWAASFFGDRLESPEASRYGNRDGDPWPNFAEHALGLEPARYEEQVLELSAGVEGGVLLRAPLGDFGESEDYTFSIERMEGLFEAEGVKAPLPLDAVERTDGRGLRWMEAEDRAGDSPVFYRLLVGRDIYAGFRED